MAEFPLLQGAIVVTFDMRLSARHTTSQNQQTLAVLEQFARETIGNDWRKEHNISPEVTVRRRDESVCSKLLCSQNKPAGRRVSI